jgi:flagellar biosynthesis/type III secretory pathway M-ring protein FliF/YscJ
LSVADEPKVKAVLDENKIWYRINQPDNQLYVSKEQSEEAQVALASVGVLVESRGQRH